MQQSRLLIKQFVGLILEARFAHSRIFIALKFCVKKPQTFTFHIREGEQLRSFFWVEQPEENPPEK